MLGLFWIVGAEVSILWLFALLGLPGSPGGESRHSQRRDLQPQPRTNLNRRPSLIHRIKVNPRYTTITQLIT